MGRPACILRAILGVVLLALVSGCGYSFTGGSVESTTEANRLDPAFREMAIIRVENPTVEAWLEPRLRGLLREEFTRRRVATWVERSKATALVTVNIKQYTRSTRVAGQQDQSVKLSTGMVLSIRVTRASDNLLLWDSGEQTQSESYYPGDSEAADLRLTDLAVRRLADLLTQGY